MEKVKVTPSQFLAIAAGVDKMRQGLSQLLPAVDEEAYRNAHTCLACAHDELQRAVKYLLTQYLGSYDPN